MSKKRRELTVEEIEQEERESEHYRRVGEYQALEYSLDALEGDVKRLAVYEASPDCTEAVKNILAGIVDALKLMREFGGK